MADRLRNLMGWFTANIKILTIVLVVLLAVFVWFRLSSGEAALDPPAAEEVQE